MQGHRIEFNLTIDKSNPSYLVVELRPNGLVYFSVYETGKPKYLLFGKREKRGLHEFATGEWNDFTQSIEGMDLSAVAKIRRTNPSPQLLRQCTMLLTFAQEIAVIASAEFQKLIPIVEDPLLSGE